MVQLIGSILPRDIDEVKVYQEMSRKDWVTYSVI